MQKTDHFSNKGFKGIYLRPIASYQHNRNGYIRAVQYRLKNNFEKNLYFWNYSVFTTTPSRYSPLSATYFA